MQAKAHSSTPMSITTLQSLSSSTKTSTFPGKRKSIWSTTLSTSAGSICGKSPPRSSATEPFRPSSSNKLQPTYSFTETKYWQLYQENLKRTEDPDLASAGLQENRTAAHLYHPQWHRPRKVWQSSRWFCLNGSKHSRKDLSQPVQSSWPCSSERVLHEDAEEDDGPLLYSAHRKLGATRSSQ